MKCKKRTTPEGNGVGVNLPEPETTPLEKAQHLIYDAWEASARKRRLELARRALKISPLCADAWTIIAEEGCDNAPDRATYFSRAVEAAEQVLGPKMFEENSGHFWMIFDTRPYMRARAGLAAALWNIDQREAAVEHYRDLLRLNPRDNQGIRYTLLAKLLELGRDGEASDLIATYGPEPAAAFVYSRALIAYRRQGNNNKSRNLLVQAVQCNPHVPSFLLGKRRIPRRNPDYYSLGDDREAIIFAGEFLLTWKKTPGALEWLAKHSLQ